MKKSDPAHIATDEEIAKIEKLITKEYKKAHKEVSKKCEDYFAKFAAKDAKWQEWVAQGTKTQKEYKEWRQGQMLVGKKWEDLRDTLAQDYTNAAQITMSITKGFAPEVYAINHNYATFQVEKGAGLDTSYALYSKESVEYMYKGKPKLYHTYGKAVAKEIKEGKQYAWDRRRITSVLTQAILQGKSIPNITKSLEQVTAGDHKAAIRNARTMMTGVQNAGRIDAMERAVDKGIPVQKQWLATLDMRTRHWHKALDGVIVDYDKPFHNEFGDIMFPGDPDADGSNLYNCRCTLLPAIKGYALDVTDPSVRPNDKLGKMTYEEWLAEKKSISNPITLPEEKAATIKGAWWKKYGGGAAKEHKFTGAEGKALAEKYEKQELTKEFKNIWSNKTVTAADYTNMKKDVTDKKWNLNKQLDKANAKGDAAAIAKYQAQMDELLEFEKQGKKYLKMHPEIQSVSPQKAKKAVSTAKTEKKAETAKKVASEAPKPEPPKMYSIWSNKPAVTPEDYPSMKKAVNDKKWQLNKQIEKAEAKGDAKAVAKYKAQLKELEEFEAEGKKLLGAAQKADDVKQATKAAKTAEKANKAATTAPEPKPTPKPKKLTEKEAVKAVEDATKKVDKLLENEYVNIWADPVSPADYAKKKAGIPAKRQYFQDKLDEAVQNGWQSKIDKFTALLDDLAEFEMVGKDYELAKAELDAAKKVYEPFIVKKEAKLKPKIDALKKDLATYASDEYDMSNVYWALKDKVKVEDYPSIKKKITSAKKSVKSDIDTYDFWLNRATTPEQQARWKKKLDEAHEKLKKIEQYEEAGKKYAKIQKQLETVEKKLASLRMPEPDLAGGAYSQARKNAALWAKTNAEYQKNDTIFDKLAKVVHSKKSAFEHQGYYHYTWGSGPFNQPLAGFKGGWGGTFVGPGKLDIDVGGYGDRIRGLTQLCEKSKYDFDFWCQSGQTLETLEGMLKIPYGTLQGMTDTQLQQFVSRVEELPQFISGAINKGGGSYTPGNMLFNIYCPKGSEALYVRGDGKFGKSEHEIILQRGGTYKITRIYWGQDTVHGGRKLIVDLELRVERGYNKFQQ